jgi:hemin uptake protein HemP
MPSFSRPALRPLQRPAVAEVPRHITSQSLLEGGREVVIQHQGGEYHLRLTRNDKLILTK